MIIALQTLVFFRESLFAAIDRLLRPYYKHFSLTFTRHGSVSDDDESEDHVFAEFDDEKGVVFFPPMYAQRYAAVSDCLMDERWCGKLEKVVDIGYHDMSFIKYLKEVPGIKRILGVDIESISLRCSSDLLGDDYVPKRENPLQVTLYQGNAADPDYRLIGCDAVIAIEMIEHMLPHDLERLVHTIFGFIKPWIAVITTPNGDFNPLFKAMERNGLRRLDHFFEWSREQFHDWCTNIVVRYPQYTVSCRGVGPGPQGTIHYGCCSQLALFVSKDYHKQQDLNLNSLALVPKVPNPSNVCDIIGSIDSPAALTESNNMICSPNDIESYTELVFSDKQSCVTIVLSPVFSVASLECRDKTAQCNLDKELGKNFLFDEEPCFGVVVPRRKTDNRVYVIEDVNSRLNCTTLQVKKFSKTTQNMLAKNKIDSLVHTREVVDEIKHLTKMLNFKNEVKEKPEESQIWNNINWGDNAPYWNQYYKIVREYNYPFEVKSEECRILDLISDEINRLIDTQYDEEFSVEANKLEIPMDHLMRVVQHITDDVERVKDLLEWNGYEVVDDMVIYSRLVVDTASVGSHDDEWRDNDTFSDWDTDVHSTSFSDGSTIVPDYHALPSRCLHRALDRKVRKLRSMLSADEDITTELDRVVCRLMKLALKTTRRRQSPLPMKWMQCKMLDLLNLTEKAIEKKKKHYVESYPLKAICYGDQTPKHRELDFSKIKEDDTANQIVHKYRHLVRSSENTNTSEEMQKYQYDIALDDELINESSKEFLKDHVASELNFEDIVRSPSLVDIEPVPDHPIKARKHGQIYTPLSRTQAWVEEDVNIVRYPNHSAHGVSSGDTDHSVNNITSFKNKKSHRKHQVSAEPNEANLDVRRRKKSASKTSYDKYKSKNVEKYKNKDKTSKTRLIKKVVKKKSSYNILIKTCSKKLSSADFGNMAVKSIRNLKPNVLQSSSSKPIPEILMDIVHMDISVEEKAQNVDVLRRDSIHDVNSIEENYLESKIATTEKSLLIDIVMDDREETIALRRTIGTDADDEPALFEQETILGSLTNVMKADSFYNKHETENVHSQTIFIYDINEPSTSKGVRHVSMDVQCGPDAANMSAMLSATTSFTKLPKIFNTGIKIGHSTSEIQHTEKKCTDFGTSTNECANSFKTITPRFRSVGIRIKDSDTMIKERAESGTMTFENEISHVVPSMPHSFDSATETQLLKPVSSRIKMEDSGSELCESVGSFRKSPFPFANLSKNTSDFQIKSSVSKDVGIDRKFSSKYVRPKLCCGGVHVHSYKDRQTSEDVVYQGEWQRYRPKPLAKRKPINSVVAKKVSEIASKKSKVNARDNIVMNKDIKLQQLTKRLPIRNANLKKIIKNEASKHDEGKKMADPNNCPKTVKFNRNVTKISSKLVASSVLTKPNKLSYVTKKPSMTTTCTLKKDGDQPQRCCKKSYLPLYLKRKLANKNKNNSLIKTSESSKTVIETNKDKPIVLLPDVVESIINDDSKKELLDAVDFDFEPRENISYVIFRNEIETNKSTPESEHSFPPRESLRRRDNSDRRSPSPQSQNSSACSSPNSIATVRARPASKNISDRRYSTSSNKSNLSNSQSESAPTKNKKFTKRAKSTKKPQDEEFDNKENVPESSKKSKESEKSTKNAFIRNKNVYRAHVTTECSLQVPSNLSRHRPQTANKSNIRIPTVPCSSPKLATSGTSSRPSVSKKSLPKSQTSLQSPNKSEIHLNKSDISSLCSQPENLFHRSNEDVIMNIVDNSLLAEWMNSTYKNVIDSHTSNILAAMRQLVEERLDFIERLSDNLEVDSKTVILSQEKLESLSISASTSFHDSSSLNNSFGTVIEREDDINSVDINDIQNIVNNTLDSVLGNESIISLSDTRPTTTDLDLLSFKSLTSASKLSEYFLAESSLNNITESLQNTGTPMTGSLRDIFERRKQPAIQNPGVLAIQAFSGFSMNVEPVAGDQPDRINIIDSETGSIALEYTRQATSEEVFISGRSSSSYESCLIDDDTVVPYWLFQIISRQQSVDEEEEDEPEELLPIPVPLAEPMFDANGNVMEPGMGAGAGAGDGRGIHSDHSQDSSGRGTSLSSSGTSSGPQSEAILIDPSAFTAQYDLLREPISSSVLVPLPLPLDSPDTSFIIAEDTARTNDINSSGERCERTTTSLMAASDVDADADVSSIDTDVPDSSDN